MSVEALVVAALVDEGTPKKAFQSGIGESDFEMHDEEFAWIVDRAEKRKPINARLFKNKFPEFEFVVPQEKLVDLIDELKKERAFLAITSGIDTVMVDLDQENAIDKAVQLREVLGDVLRVHSPVSDVLLKSDWQRHFGEMKERAIMSDNGEVFGIPTGIRNFDHHLGGFQPATSYAVLGRPGDAKSLLLGNSAAQACLSGYRVGFFSPEMTEWQHRCRINTILSAQPEIQEAVGLRGAFRNRALRDGRGFNMKTYKRFLKYIDDNLPGEICLFTQKYRREKMSPSFIESRVEELGLDFVIIDPIYKLKSPRRRNLKHEELQDIVDALQDMSMGFNIPVIMSNQANRALVGNRGMAPTKDSSFGSDAPVQEADVVMGVKYFEDEHLMRVNCDKNRHGERFKCEINCWPNIGKMEDITPIKGEFYNGYDPEKVAEITEALKEEEKERVG